MFSLTLKTISYIFSALIALASILFLVMIVFLVNKSDDLALIALESGLPLFVATGLPWIGSIVGVLLLGPITLICTNFFQQTLLLSPMLIFERVEKTLQITVLLARLSRIVHRAISVLLQYGYEYPDRLKFAPDSIDAGTTHDLSCTRIGQIRLWLQYRKFAVWCCSKGNKRPDR